MEESEWKLLGRDVWEGFRNMGGSTNCPGKQSFQHTDSLFLPLWGQWYRAEYLAVHFFESYFAHLLKRRVKVTVKSSFVFLR